MTMEVFKYWQQKYADDEEVYELEIVRKFKSHNVIKERVELYKDFTINLLHYMYDSYLGSDFIKTEYDKRGHFAWAYGKVLEEFQEENISFYGNDDLFEYFYVYFTDQFYNKKKIETFTYYNKFWVDVFDVSKNKERKKFEVLLQIYEIFDDSLMINTTTPIVLF